MVNIVYKVQNRHINMMFAPRPTLNRLIWLSVLTLLNERSMQQKRRTGPFVPTINAHRNNIETVSRGYYFIWWPVLMPNNEAFPRFSTNFRFGWMSFESFYYIQNNRYTEHSFAVSILLTSDWYYHEQTFALLFLCERTIWNSYLTLTCIAFGVQRNGK